MTHLLIDHASSLSNVASSNQVALLHLPCKSHAITVHMVCVTLILLSIPACRSHSPYDKVLPKEVLSRLKSSEASALFSVPGIEMIWAACLWSKSCQLLRAPAFHLLMSTLQRRTFGKPGCHRCMSVDVRLIADRCSVSPRQLLDVKNLPNRQFMEWLGSHRRR